MTSHRTLTQDELLAEARTRFGPNPYNWAFTCPSCGDTATGQDFKDALAAHPRTGRDNKPLSASDLLGQECIGRTLGALKETPYRSRGCEWAAYGLFQGPWEITSRDGKSIWSFPLADADQSASTPSGR